MTGGNYTALHPARTPVAGKERVSLSRKTVPQRARPLGTAAAGMSRNRLKMQARAIRKGAVQGSASGTGSPL